MKGIVALFILSDCPSGMYCPWELGGLLDFSDSDPSFVIPSGPSVLHTNSPALPPLSEVQERKTRFSILTCNLLAHISFKLQPYSEVK